MNVPCADLQDVGLLGDGDDIRLLPDGRPLFIVVETAGESTEQTDVLELIGDLMQQDYANCDVTIVDQNPEPLPSFRKAVAAERKSVRLIHLRPAHVCVARNVSIKAADGEIMHKHNGPVTEGQLNDLITEHLTDA